MACRVEVTDRENLPVGQDWIFVEIPGGDVYFVVARDAEAFVLPTRAVEVILEKVATHARLPLRLANHVRVDTLVS